MYTTITNNNKKHNKMKNKAFYSFYRAVRKAQQLLYRENITLENILPFIGQVVSDSELEYLAAEVKEKFPAEFLNYAEAFLIRYYALRKISPVLIHYYHYRELELQGLEFLAELARKPALTLGSITDKEVAIEVLLQIGNEETIIEYLANPVNKEKFFAQTAEEIFIFFQSMMQREYFNVINFLKKEYFENSLIRILDFFNECEFRDCRWRYLVDGIIFKTEDDLTNLELINVLMEIENMSPSLSSFRLRMLNRFCRLADERREDIILTKKKSDLLDGLFVEIISSPKSISELIEVCKFHHIEYLLVKLIKLLKMYRDDCPKIRGNFFVQELKNVALKARYSAVLYELQPFLTRQTPEDNSQLLKLTLESRNLNVLKCLITKFPKSFFIKKLEQMIRLIYKTNQLEAFELLCQNDIIIYQDSTAFYFEKFILSAAIQQEFALADRLLDYLPEDRQRVMCELIDQHIPLQERKISDHTTFAARFRDFQKGSGIDTQRHYSIEVEKLIHLGAYFIKAYATEPVKIFFELREIFSTARGRIASQANTDEAYNFGMRRAPKYDGRHYYTPMVGSPYSQYKDFFTLPSFNRIYESTVTIRASSWEVRNLKTSNSSNILTTIRVLEDSLGWFHTNAVEFKVIEPLLADCFQTVVQAELKEEFIENLGKFIWLFAQMTPYQRGSAAILEWFIKSICLAKGYRFPLIDKSCLLDCLVLSIPSEIIFLEMFKTEVGPNIIVLPEAEQFKVSHLGQSLSCLSSYASTRGRGYGFFPAESRGAGAVDRVADEEGILVPAVRV